MSAPLFSPHAGPLSSLQEYTKVIFSRTDSLEVDPPTLIPIDEVSSQDSLEDIANIPLVEVDLSSALEDDGIWLVLDFTGKK